MQNECLKFTRKNPEIRPFEPGGEVQLELLSSRNNCSLFALGSHSKKRPHNLTFGRMYDFRLYDAIEFGIVSFSPVKQFDAATFAQLGNKPAFIFVGEQFESDAELKQTKSMMLDFFRGRQVESINLKGLDRVIFVTHHTSQNISNAGDTTSGKKIVVFRQYAVKYKKSGTRIPRVELLEMGPRLDLEVRRTKEAPVDVEKEAKQRPKVVAKKQKNVSDDGMDGKVGRIYMPKQDVEKLALQKMKGTKREAREAKAEKKGSEKKAKASAAAS